MCNSKCVVNVCLSYSAWQHVVTVVLKFVIALINAVINGSCLANACQYAAFHISFTLTRVDVRG